MKKGVRIVYLWSEMSGYTQDLLLELSKYSDSIDVIFWDKKKINSSEYKYSNHPKITFHARSVTHDKEILQILNQASPNIVVVSGWMDKSYINACKKYKKKDPFVKIVAGIDDQWIGSIRQYIGIMYFHLFYRRVFDYMWVSGAEQYCYSRFFGYKPNKIISYLYSGAYNYNEESYSVNNKFIYVGRLMKSKGVDLLIDAHKALSQSEREKFPLHIYGSGELLEYVKINCDDHLHYHGWVNTEDFISVMSAGGIGVMPSRKEAWGVSIHEYTQFGLPILISDSCGSKNELCIPGYNGYTFKNDSLISLTNALRKFIHYDTEIIKQMSKNSFKLSARINTEFSAASLLSLLN